jgi:hypothetical protein
MTWRVRVVAQLSDLVPVWLLGIYRILVGDSGKTGCLVGKILILWLDAEEFNPVGDCS